MSFLNDVLLFLHLLGMASLFGGLFVQVRSDPRVVNNAIFHGILTQVVTGRCSSASWRAATRTSTTPRSASSSWWPW